MTTGYLSILLLVLLLFGGFSYFLLSKAVYTNEDIPSQVFTTEIDIPNNDQTNSTVTSGNNYKNLLGYTLSANKIKEIQASTLSIFQMQTSLGNLNLDQSKFITKDMSGGQKVWVYYRMSPTDATKYELMIIVRPETATRQILGQYTGVLIYALPVIFMLVFVVGYFLLKRMLRPIDTIKAAVQRINRNNSFKNTDLQPGSELEELSASLNQAFGSLQDTIDRERQIVAEASHEIRAPLTVMQGEASLALRRQRSVEEYQKCLEVFSRESAYLAATVNKILLTAQLDNASGLANAEDIDLSGFLTELAPAFRTLSEKRGLIFDSSIEPRVKIRGDKLKLRELFFNLIENAAKYNRQGGEVSLSLKSENNFARIDVSDTGIGIKPEHLGKIFDRFYSVGKASSREESGAGLGLAICKRIADLHQGRIEVVSKFGRGSTFSVFLRVGA
jgi:signal transduction histidine kinase